MATVHQFCPVHRCGYNADLDPCCPQCAIGRMAPPPQLDYDVVSQSPLDDAGNRLDRRTLKPVK